MKPLFPALNVPSIQPSVLGLVCGADHEISTNDGTIYIQLHPTDDEIYAEIHFNFEMDYEYVAPAWDTVYQKADLTKNREYKLGYGLGQSMIKMCLCLIRDKSSKPSTKRKPPFAPPPMLLGEIGEL